MSHHHDQQRTKISLRRLLPTSSTILLGTLVWSMTCLDASAEKVAEPLDSIPITQTDPSLWWIKERLEQSDQPWIEKITVDGNKVKVVIIPSLWIKANYLDRFSFLYKIGQEAQVPQTYQEAQVPKTYIVELTDRRNNVLGKYSVVNGKWSIISEQMQNNPFRVTMPSVFNNP